MILESSKDYGTGTITIIFGNPIPIRSEVNAYTQENYGMTGAFEIHPPSNFRGMENPGVIKVQPI